MHMEYKKTSHVFPGRMQTEKGKKFVQNITDLFFHWSIPVGPFLQQHVILWTWGHINTQALTD